MQLIQIGMDEALKIQQECESAEYEAFVEKFKPKKTTDDCYTPAPVFDAVVAWAAKAYGFRLSDVVRPFWPGGDYRSFPYPDGFVVCDNPPFSILSEIIGFYMQRGIRFFLFAPSLTLFSAARRYDVTCIVADCSIVYENGAKVKTGFVTNMDDVNRFTTAPDLHAAVRAAVDAVRAEQVRTLPKYEYPDAVVSAANLHRIAQYVRFAVPKREAAFIRAMDAQKVAGKEIFGGGFLISERAAAERAAATEWTLSDRERRLMAQMEETWKRSNAN